MEEGVRRVVRLPQAGRLLGERRGRGDFPAEALSDGESPAVVGVVAAILFERAADRAVDCQLVVLLLDHVIAAASHGRKEIDDVFEAIALVAELHEGVNPVRDPVLVPQIRGALVRRGGAAARRAEVEGVGLEEAVRLRVVGEIEREVERARIRVAARDREAGGERARERRRRRLVIAFFTLAEGVFSRNPDSLSEKVANFGEELLIFRGSGRGWGRRFSVSYTHLRA